MFIVCAIEIVPALVAPNPVLGGQSTYVTHEWTAEEQSGMRVEVLKRFPVIREVLITSKITGNILFKLFYVIYKMITLIAISFYIGKIMTM